MKKIYNISLGGLTVALFAFAPLFIGQVHAQTMTQEKVDQQYTIVHSQLRSTLVEHVKLLQMVFIQHLEGRLAELQAAQ